MSVFIPRRNHRLARDTRHEVFPAVCSHSRICEAEADERISHYPDNKRSATLPLLHIVQHQFGYISAAAIDWVADKLGLEPIKVLEVVTFYPGFRQSAPGKFHIRVCRTLSCAMGGSYELMERLCELTGIDRSQMRSAPPSRSPFRPAEISRSSSPSASPPAARPRCAW